MGSLPQDVKTVASISGRAFAFGVALLVFPAKASGQELNVWGKTFDCAVDWFRPCAPKKAAQELKEEKEKKPKPEGSAAASIVAGPNADSLPRPVKDVLENPSIETARAYVEWARKGNEALSAASEYIAQAERELGPQRGALGEKAKKSEESAKRGLVALYYFFAPDDPSGAEDVRALNKMWREEEIGIVGIAVRGSREEVANFIKLKGPLFPVRRGEEEVKLIGPKSTPELYLALPLEKKIFKIGSSITEAAIKEGLGKAVAEVVKERFRVEPESR